MLAVSTLVEPGGSAALAGAWGWPARLAWLYLLLAGSLMASIIYFVLVRDWGASRTGTYAFVSPVIAVVIGSGLLDERLRTSDVVGMALMLLAAGLVLQRPRGGERWPGPWTAPCQEPAAPGPASILFRCCAFQFICEHLAEFYHLRRDNHPAVAGSWVAREVIFMIFLGWIEKPQLHDFRHQRRRPNLATL